MLNLLTKPLYNLPLKLGNQPIKDCDITKEIQLTEAAHKLARKWGLNVNSQTTQNLLNSLDSKLADFISHFCQGSIKNAEGFPEDFIRQEYTVRQALSKGGPIVRKLLTDGRFKK